MTRFALRRLALLPIALLLANFAGFAYAHFANYLQQRRNPFFAPLEPPAPIFPAYAAYLQKALQLDFGSLPIGAGQPIVEAVSQAILASTGLVIIAFGISIIFGLLLGLAAVRTTPPGVAGWLAPLSSVGLAMPSFFLGSLFLAGTLAYVIRFGGDSQPLPMGGYGWDLHLVFPVLALMLRPAVQIAQITASTLSNELTLRYVVTARAIGNSWLRVRWYHALANALSTIILTQASSFRLLMGELIVVEWLFAWPGLGRLLAFILIPSQASHEAETIFFLHPPLLAATLAAFALFFLLADLVASILVRLVDPRLRTTESQS